MRLSDPEEQTEEAWRQAQGPDVAMEYKFREQVLVSRCPRLCNGHAVDRMGAARPCANHAIWKTARSPYSMTGVRYWCKQHCPDVPEGMP